MAHLDLDQRRKQLEDRLRQLGGRLDSIERSLDETPDRDFEERATEREEDEVLETMGKGGAHEIAQIRAALDRMERGIYGICQQCGNEITPERLDVLPATPFCRNCAV